MSKGAITVLVLAVLGLVGAEAALWMAFHYTPTQINAGSLWVIEATGSPRNLYESYRIFFLHLPSAYATALCCVATLIGGVMWLLSKKDKWESVVVAGAETGVIAGGVVLLTGSFWADYAWGDGSIGSGWNWEPRLTTMLILWLAFAALLGVRKAMDNPRQRSQITAVYGILLAPLYPLVSQAIKIGQVSHPADFSTQMSAPEIATTKHVATIGIILVWASLFGVRLLWNRLESRIRGMA